MSYQFIWWFPRWRIGFRKATRSLKLIYAWYLWLGFIEIRKWQPRSAYKRLLKEYKESTNE